MMSGRYSLSPATGAFVASQGRCKLYRELLAPLGERVLYSDTDSCIWHFVPGMENPKFPKAPCFGKLTDDTEGLPIMRYRGPTSKTHALEFPSLAQCQELNNCPEYVKHHGEIVFTEKALELIVNRYIVKCKGFTLNTSEAKSTLCGPDARKLRRLTSKAECDRAAGKVGQER